MPLKKGMDKTIFCSECTKRGLTPKKLGVVEDVERAGGQLRLWCKQCKKEIRVFIRDGRIVTTDAATDKP